MKGDRTEPILDCKGGMKVPLIVYCTRKENLLSPISWELERCHGRNKETEIGILGIESEIQGQRVDPRLSLTKESTPVLFLNTK